MLAGLFIIGNGLVRVDENELGVFVVVSKQKT
jgi:hypothetical protein